MDISEFALQGLTRLFERGVAKTADKLAAMSKSPWTLQAAAVHAGTRTLLQDRTPEDSKPHYGNFFSMPNGSMIALFPESSGERIARAYLGKDADRLLAAPDAVEYVLCEISNILANTVAAELADACDVGFLISAPEMLRGGKAELCAEFLRRLPGGDETMAATGQVHLTSASLSARCVMSMLLDEKLTENLLEHLSAPTA